MEGNEEFDTQEPAEAMPPTTEKPRGPDPESASGEFEAEGFLFTRPEEGPSAPDEEIDPVEPGAKVPPALMITVESWTTPIAAIVFLVIGLIGGYFLRPLITSEPNPASAAGSSTVGQTAAAPTSPAQSAGDRAALMDMLVPQVRHFLGDPNAPITLIEFSDFQ